METLGSVRLWVAKRNAPEWVKEALDDAVEDSMHLWTHLSTEHALLTNHLDAEGFSGLHPSECEVCDVLVMLAP